VWCSCYPTQGWCVRTTRVGEALFVDLIVTIVPGRQNWLLLVACWVWHSIGEQACWLWHLLEVPFGFTCVVTAMQQTSMSKSLMAHVVRVRSFHIASHQISTTCILVGSLCVQLATIFFIQFLFVTCVASNCSEVQKCSWQVLLVLT